MYCDLTKATVDELARLVFDHAVIEGAEGASSKEWFWTEEVDITIDPPRQLELAAALFAEAGRLRRAYSAAQLEQGLWFMFGPGGEEWFVGLLRVEELPLALRDRFIRAIGDLYEHLLSHVQLDTATFMLWDLLIDQFFSANATAPVVPDELQPAIFETLSRILALPDHECQRAALHGLGHLRHRDTATLVAAYLERNSDLPQRIVEYAHRVRDGAGVL